MTPKAGVLRVMNNTENYFSRAFENVLRKLYFL